MFIQSSHSDVIGWWHLHRFQTAHLDRIIELYSQLNGEGLLEFRYVNYKTNETELYINTDQIASLAQTNGYCIATMAHRMGGYFEALESIVRRNLQLNEHTI